MRESVLLALIHIFAIVSTVNPGGISSRGKKILRSYLRRYLNRELEEEYFSLFENNLEFYSNELRSVDKGDLADGDSLISFQITNICRQIKKGLFLEERMIVFLQLLEFTFEDGTITDQEKTIIDIVARTFNISPKEYDNAFAFMIGRNYDKVSPDCMLVVESENPKYTSENEFGNYKLWKHLKIKGFRGQLYVLHIASTGSLILTYDGSLPLYFKGRDIIACRPYLLERGVNIKGPGMEPIYYSKVYKAFLIDNFHGKVVFEGHDVEFRFKNSDNGIRPMSFRLESGNMVGIMGGSGVGKTTLLNLLHGKMRPEKGNIYINGYDIHDDSELLKGLIGFVPQDDMLLEELTVYQNMYFNARLCFGDYNEDQLKDLVEKVLKDLDLMEIKDLQVGDILNKKVSGGQRKRLNIGLEMMREPVVLFVDEPTSGLSSHDSEKVMHLLRKHALSGKLVIANIHQPSSDILKLFDRLWLIDKGGYMIYDGDPVEALVYFKTETSQANAAESECPNCLNVESEKILHIVEVKVVDNDGYEGKERQVTPEEWYERYKKKMMPVITGWPEKTEVPPNNFKVPGKLYQMRTFVKRNLTRKLADRQYIILNLVEAPVLAFILGFLSRYSAASKYIFSENRNYPVFLFMGVVVALFLGLMISAEEIFKDRKILVREKFLNLSRFSYLFSKINFLFFVSAIQSLLFVVVSAFVLQIRGMFWQQWLIFFTTACYGNLIGLNISSGMRTVVSIYILIPLILVPQLLLGGAMIRFDDLHKSIGNKEYVPFIGDLMATRWAYEAVMVEGFKSNNYRKPTFDIQLEIEQNNYYKDQLIRNLKTDAINYIRQRRNIKGESENIKNKISVLRYHVAELSNYTGISTGSWFSKLNINDFSDLTQEYVSTFFDSVSSFLVSENSRYYREKAVIEDEVMMDYRKKGITFLATAYDNQRLDDIVLNQGGLNEGSYYDLKYRWVQKATPVFMKPKSRAGRAQFYAPYKQVGNLRIGTIFFNVAAIWFMTFVFFITLYYNLLKKFINYLEALRLPFWRKFGRAALNTR
ncbi:MAG TPA: ATP-binding cassette domain-containing protein [Bacteroidales bacterium]|nr:ATP-binding cassette domain-containing protein [Bacteroidales bacterium]